MLYNIFFKLVIELLRNNFQIQNTIYLIFTKRYEKKLIEILLRAKNKPQQKHKVENSI